MAAAGFILFSEIEVLGARWKPRRKQFQAVSSERLHWTVLMRQQSIGGRRTSLQLCIRATFREDCRPEKCDRAIAVDLQTLPGFLDERPLTLTHFHTWNAFGEPFLF